MSETLTNAQILGAWISIFLTLCTLSFLYDDNPFYKLAEHLFIGTSIGIIVNGAAGFFGEASGVSQNIGPRIDQIIRRVG